MLKKRIFIRVTMFVLIIVIIIQAVIISKPAIIGRHEITSAENAIIIAKAALLHKYGESEIANIEFDAFIGAQSNPDYWNVCELYVLGYPPHVLVRRSDGKVILNWD